MNMKHILFNIYLFTLKVQIHYKCTLDNNYIHAYQKREILYDDDIERNYRTY